MRRVCNGSNLDGKRFHAKVKEELKAEVEHLSELGIVPGLAVVIVGNDPASRVYVNNKKKACDEVGIYSEEHALPEETTQEELLRLVGELNTRPDIDGILVQLPLPAHLDDKAVIEAISPEKDVDAFHVENVGRIMLGDYKFLPCTPAGVMELIKETGIEVSGKECVVVGRSNIGRQAYGLTASASKRYGDGLPFAYQGSQGSHPPGRYFGSGYWQGQVCDCGHGKGRRRSH